jgi:hypothetical protein
MKPKKIKWDEDLKTNNEYMAAAYGNIPNVGVDFYVQKSRDHGYYDWEFTINDHTEDFGDSGTVDDAKADCQKAFDEFALSLME